MEIIIVGVSAGASIRVEDLGGGKYRIVLTENSEQFSPDDGDVETSSCSTKDRFFELDERVIRAALESTGGNVTRAARMLRISRKTLRNKMTDFGIGRDNP